MPCLASPCLVSVPFPSQTVRNPQYRRVVLAEAHPLCKGGRAYPQSGCAQQCPPLLQLSDLVALVRGKLSRMHRAVLSALIVIEVHAKDVVSKLIQENVVSVNDFEWISQLR